MIPRITAIDPTLPASAQAQQRRRIRRRLYKAYIAIARYGLLKDYDFLTYFKLYGSKYAAVSFLTRTHPTQGSQS